MGEEDECDCYSCMEPERSDGSFLGLDSNRLCFAAALESLDPSCLALARQATKANTANNRLRTSNTVSIALLLIINSYVNYEALPDTTMDTMGYGLLVVFSTLIIRLNCIYAVLSPNNGNHKRLGFP